MRLAKYLSIVGVASRRASEEIVRSGRVAVGGLTVTDPAFDVAAGVGVTLDAGPLPPPPQPVVYMLNKPPGVVSTARDTHGRPTVVSLVGRDGVRLYPVGRLDAETTGLILLSNDGELAQRLTHPSFEVEKVYVAQVEHPPVRWKAVRTLRRGVELDDGPTAPAYVRLLDPGTLELTLREGRKHQVRRMCAAVGHPVISLARVRLGPLELGELAVGEHRRLGSGEVEELRHAGSQARRPPLSARSGRRPRAASSRAARQRRTPR
jgi:23S rRNA pseudouridine2605 synthase